MIAIPICDSTVIARPLLKMRGATSIGMANKVHTTQRPVFIFLNAL